MQSFIDKIILCATFMIGLMGGADIALRSLAIVVAIDYVTGVLSAIYNKKVSSKIGLKGIAKKCGYFLAVILACVLDSLFGQTSIIRMLVIYFLVANDGISIVENLAEMKVKLPKKVLEVLKQLKEENK